MVCGEVNIEVIFIFGVMVLIVVLISFGLVIDCFVFEGFFFIKNWF